ncbi:DsrE family protein [Fundidesulfovibrio butyratiphilus]
MQYDLVVHVDSDERKVLDLALGNIVNYLAALPEETFQVDLVANGPAVTLFVRPGEAVARSVADLGARGVRFKMCSNALRKFGVAEADLLDGCQVVPAGVVELVRLQRQGMAYIKP